MRTAFIFPGQGSQSVGMGKALAEEIPSARAVFEEVDEALGEKLSSDHLRGSGGRAHPHPECPAGTDGGQHGGDPGARRGGHCGRRRMPPIVAGHSLGEYSALAAAGSFSIGDAARLLRVRGDAMQKAVPEGVGAMAALLGLDLAAAEAIAADAATADEVCEVANDNAPGQVVVSGPQGGGGAGLRRSPRRRAPDGPAARRLGSLPLRADAARRRGHGERPRRNEDPSAGRPARRQRAGSGRSSDPTEIRQRLVEQVTGTVRWRELMALARGERRRAHGRDRCRQGARPASRGASSPESRVRPIRHAGGSARARRRACQIRRELGVQSRRQTRAGHGRERRHRRRYRRSRCTTQGAIVTLSGTRRDALRCACRQAGRARPHRAADLADAAAVDRLDPGGGAADGRARHPRQQCRAHARRARACA